jgi:DNA-directed RNA polymerase specialized sigma24 family protein
MAADDSIADVLAQLKKGDQEATRMVFQRYFARLETLARQRLQGTPRGEADSEDLALSAFASFCRAAAGGRFPELANRNQLWAVLVGITRRKACDYWRRAVRGERREERVGLNFEQVLDREPTPELAATVADECKRLLHVLGDDTLRKIALCKLEGDADKEIAVKLDCGLRTVERKLERIRRIWEEAISA